MTEEKKKLSDEKTEEKIEKMEEKAENFEEKHAASIGIVPEPQKGSIKT